MEIKSKIIDSLNERFNDYIKKHEAHKQRVIKALDWWDEHSKSRPVYVDDEHSISFVNCLLEVNGIECMCVKNDFTGVPFFVAEFHLLPLSMDGDIGNGAGMRKVVRF